VDGGVGVAHVEDTKVDPPLPRVRLFVEPGSHFGVLAGGEDVDDLVVLHVGHDGGIGAVARRAPNVARGTSQ
jgi:hypothetical protein